MGNDKNQRTSKRERDKTIIITKNFNDSSENRGIEEGWQHLPVDKIYKEKHGRTPPLSCQ
jgi:hypothetical protein